ncbi:hypothetical protein, partial [Flavobacterium sp. AG291]|uniref:hypothetical protein n=1 Tax=Flavobacterium sp. AG291 TaxID=2184000 RepID=UPI001F1BDC2A
PDCADGTAICGRVCRRLSFENPSSFTMKGFLFYSTIGTAICGSPIAIGGSRLCCANSAEGLVPFEDRPSYTMKVFLLYSTIGTAICGSPDSYRGSSPLLHQFG